MNLICPYCKNKLDDRSVCSHCQKNIKWVNELYTKSEKYYANGYELATRSKLTEARESLSRAIMLNKYHVDARNLLGVVQFEIGNIGEALRCWKKSIAIDPENERAKDYLQRLQNNPRQFENYKEALRLYNLSLKYLNEGNEDVAMIRLKKAITLNEKFLEARNLLTACYIKNRQYAKAMKQIQGVLLIDENNAKALKYLKEVKLEDTKQEEDTPPRIVSDKASVKPQKIINRGNLLATAILYFAIGCVCMMGVQVGLIIPEKTAKLEQEIHSMSKDKKQLEEQIEMLAIESNERIRELEEAVEKQKKYSEELQKTSNKLRQQQKLSTVKQYENSREWIMAADELYNIAVEELDQDEQAEYARLGEIVLPKATQELYNKGYSWYKENNDIEAKSAFEKVVLYGFENPLVGKALYYMGEIEEKNGNLVRAKKYYEDVVGGYEGNTVYYWAQNKLRELEE